MSAHSPAPGAKPIVLAYSGGLDTSFLVPWIAEKERRPVITVIRTMIGAAASVAVALDKAEWPEVVGTISGDDTIFLATADARAQQRLIERLNSLFRT